MDNNKRQKDLAMSFIKTYGKDAQDELEAVVDRQLNAIKEHESSSSKNVTEDTNRERVNENFEYLSKDRGDQNKFLVLVCYNEKVVNENNLSRDWEIFNNRQDTYNFLKESIDDLDLDATRVVAQTLPFTNDLSAGSFLVYCLDSGKIEDNWDPRGEYLPEDYEMEV